MRFAAFRADSGRDQRGKAIIISLANIMTVQIFELLEVETRGRTADIGEIEPLDRLVAADDLIVAMAPAQTQQIIADRFGQESQFVAIGLDAERAVPLGQLGAVGTMDQRDMRIDRLRPAHPPDDAELAKGVVE